MNKQDYDMPMRTSCKECPALETKNGKDFCYYYQSYTTNPCGNRFSEKPDHTQEELHDEWVTYLENNPPPTVEQAAIFQDEKIYTLPRPNRHHNIIHDMILKGHKRPITGEQGFVLSDGSFVDRRVAKIVALEAKQITKTRNDDLFSEDLW